MNILGRATTSASTEQLLLEKIRTELIKLNVVAQLIGPGQQFNPLDWDLTDFTNNDIYYYGGENSELKWQINKWNNIDGSKQFANITNNPTYTTLNDAWVDKLTLNYN
jgi:hypothetical protein